jgi:FKBP-type peptidyl-prolyl cis-trans isomerase FklB
MKSVGAGLLAFIFMITLAYGEENTELSSDKDKTSYALGMNIAQDFKKRHWDINPASFAKGFEDSFSGSKTLVSDEEMTTLLIAFQKSMMKKQIEEQQAAGEKNKKEGEDFLAANKTKKGVKTTSSGLQYKIIKEGNGQTPRADDTVTTHYRGTLIDGTEFDSSYKRNEPATFPVNGVIPGWTEALQLMKTGSKWQLFIPSKLAYGEQGAGQVIGPNAVLIFDIDLLSIDPAKAEQAPKP